MNESSECANCGATLTGRFCAHCGEARLTARDLHVSHLVESVISTVTNADGKLFLTLQRLVASPGLLTLEYIEGRRSRYIKPVPLFFIANLVFFLLHPFIPGDTLTTTLANHAHLQPYSPWVSGIVDHYLADRHETFEELARRFDPLAKNEAKSLIILMVPMFALVVGLLQWGRRRYSLEHLVFSLHFMAWWLLLAILVLSIVTIAMTHASSGWPLVDRVLELLASLTILIAQALYLYFAFKRAYGETRMAAAIKAVLASVAMLFAIIPVYRLALFFATWLTI